jgi:peroxiredoxin
LRGIQKNIETFNQAGVRPVAISVDPPDVSQKLASEEGLSFPVLSDPKLDASGRFDLIHKGAGPNGQDIVRSAEFLLDSSGTVRWRMLTENYWVRARPEQILEAAKALP